MAQLTESLTVLITPLMRETLNQRAAREERSVGQIVRHGIACYLAFEDDSELETLTDKTPELPLS